MQYSINSSDSELLSISLSGEIDHHTTADIRHGIDAEIERYKPHRLVLDFGMVTFMDSSGIGLVMGRYRLMEPYGGIIEITNVPPALKRVMQIAGLYKLAQIDEGGVVNAK